jgi:hypothetical protein
MQHNRLRGRDLHAPTNELVENQSGTNIGALKVVYLSGQGNAYPKVGLADPSLHLNFGVTYDAIANTKAGSVCAFGFMFEVDTSAWPVFTNLYSDNMGNLTTVINGGIVAQVIKQDATDGILYVTTESGSVNVLSWRLQGNLGIDPAIDFLGTVDAEPLRIRTNNQFRAVIDENGRFGLGPDITAPANHFHQKSHVGFSGSGLQQETFSLLTQANTPQQLLTVDIAQNSVVKIEISILSRSADGTKRAAFTRTGLFYRQGSNVQVQRTWQTDFTEKSDPGFDVSYSMGVNQLQINVKSPVSSDTYWTGHIKIEALATDA